MNRNLFDEFEAVTAKQWKQKIQFDLKGADYNETLVWKSPDGIQVRPFYHPDESPSAKEIIVPGHWEIIEPIYAGSVEKAKNKATEALEKGAESLWITIPSEDINIKKIIQQSSAATRIFLKPEFLSRSFLQDLNSTCLPGSQIFVQNDPIGKLARSGNWFTKMEDDLSMLPWSMEQTPALSSKISVDSGLYQNAGATIPQQLAYALAHLNEYFNSLNHLPQRQKSQLNIQVITAIGPNYFFEIAKLRALRLLYMTLAREYSFPQTCTILAEPSRRNKTLYDYNVNLLRTTTESMSAILGGADGICNMPYDAIFRKTNEFSSRLSRNQLLILKHESFFDKISNPAEGSYYIETLTSQLADKALEIFKEIEKGGGFLRQLKEGTIQKKIAQSALKEQERFNSGDLVLIGTNKYPNPDDRMKEDLELFPFLKQKPRKTLIQPILEKRLSEQEERNRLEQEKK